MSIQRIEELTHRLKEVDAALARYVGLLEAVVQHTPDPIVVRDREHRVLLCNEAHAAAYGKHAGDLIGLQPIDYIPPHDAATITQWDDHVMQTGKPFYQEEPHPSLDGKILYTVKIPYFNSSTEPVGVVTLTRDVTPLALERDHLRARVAELEADLPK